MALLVVEAQEMVNDQLRVSLMQRSTFVLMINLGIGIKKILYNKVLYLMLNLSQAKFCYESTIRQS